MLWLALSINLIIALFCILVACLMLVFIHWNRLNHRANPELSRMIGQTGHGTALR